MRAAIFLLVIAVVSTGCGYKGPLTLPKPEAQKAAPKPAAEPAEKKADGVQ